VYVLLEYTVYLVLLKLYTGTILNLSSLPRDMEVESSVTVIH